MTMLRNPNERGKETMTSRKLRKAIWTVCALGFIISFVGSGCAGPKKTNKQGVWEPPPGVSDWLIYEGGGKCSLPKDGEFYDVPCRKGDACMSRAELFHLVETVKATCSVSP